MDGITFQEGEGKASVCHVHDLSDELKGIIRDRLSSICHGAAKAAGKSKLYAYSVTLREFLNRYESKSENIQKGMIGELLTHVLLIHFMDNYSSINPYFNMEEESIKKAFDLVLRDEQTGELWYSEVKSGEAATQSSEEKTNTLLSVAKSELKEKLESSRFALWQNAINGARVSIDAPKLKGEIEKILEQCNVDAIENNAQSMDHNAIVISVVYNNLSDLVSVEAVSQKHQRMASKNEFKELMTFAVQKETYQAIVDFFEEEAEDA